MGIIIFKLEIKMEASNENKFNMVKKQLESLNCHQEFGIGSSSLIENLLSDLLKTKEGLLGLQNRNAELIEIQKNFEYELEPLKRENKTIVQENNELHYTKLKLKEDKCENDQQMVRQICQLEEE